MEGVGATMPYGRRRNGNRKADTFQELEGDVLTEEGKLVHGQAGVKAPRTMAMIRMLVLTL